MIAAFGKDEKRNAENLRERLLRNMVMYWRVELREALGFSRDKTMPIKFKGKLYKMVLMLAFLIKNIWKKFIARMSRGYKKCGK